jgi:hypothetical protein
LLSAPKNHSTQTAKELMHRIAEEWLSECLCLLKSQVSFAIQKGVSRALVMRNVDARCEMDDDDDDCASVPAENPEDLTDEEGIDLDVDDLDWNDLNY